MSCRERVEAYLREHGVDFEVRSHTPAFTAQQVAAADHRSGREFAKVVMVVADGEMRMLVLPASEMVDFAMAPRVLGAADVRLAEEKEFAPLFPDCDTGAMPPFGNLYRTTVAVDASLAARARIAFLIGSHTETMSLAYRDFDRLVQPLVMEIGSERVTG